VGAAVLPDEPLPASTVNTHIRDIYAKLQAGGRSSAVQRARELRLLSAVHPGSR
jgi:ATP/maltotriose-dependent transcriptional regulator MalT